MNYFIANKELTTCFKVDKGHFESFRLMLEKSCIEYTERFDEFYKQIEVSLDVYHILYYLYESGIDIIQICKQHFK